MKYTEFFNMQEKKRIITEIWKKPEKLSDGKKSEVNLSLDDVQSVPTRFKLYFIFNIEFICSEIRKKYEDASSVKNTQTQIQKSMSSKQTSMISIEPKFVNYKLFYSDIIQKNFSAKSIKLNLNKFIESGTYNLEDFFISKITYPLVDGKVTSDIILWKTFIQKDKKNLKSSPINIKFGLAVEFTASNMYKIFSRTEVLELSKIFIPEFENSILEQSPYYRITKSNEAGQQNVQQNATKALKEDSPFTTRSQLYPAQELPKEDAPDRGPVLKDLKLKNKVSSTITYALGRFGTPTKPLEIGKTISGVNQFLKILKSAYKYKPEQKFPLEVTSFRLNQWLNGHDPLVDGIPLKVDPASKQITVIDTKEIQKMQADKEKEKIKEVWTDKPIISLEDPMYEIFASPYKYEKSISQKKRTSKTYTFSPDNRGEFNVYVNFYMENKIYRSPKIQMSVDFSDEFNSSEISGKGDAFKIFSTIVKIITDQIKEAKGSIKSVLIRANADESSRISLYKKMIERFANDAKWKIHSETEEYVERQSRRIKTHSIMLIPQEIPTN